MDIIISIPKFVFEPAAWLSILVGIGIYAAILMFSEDYEYSFIRSLYIATATCLIPLFAVSGGLGSAFLMFSIFSEQTASASSMYHFFYYSVALLVVIAGSLGGVGLWGLCFGRLWPEK